ncbi:MAG: TonB-dependent receptor, partial [Gracilimonas sp.]
DSHIRNYYADEQIYAGYGMLDIEYDPFTLMAGIRAEFSNMDYDGRKVEFNRFGQFDSVKNTSATNSYMNLFPNARLLYQINDQSEIHLAYSKTIRRPDFQMLNPFVLALPQDTLLYAGNTELDPLKADNFDLGWNYAFSNKGFISVNVFFKSLSDYIDLREDELTIQRDEYPVFNGLFEDGENQITIHQQKFQNSSNNATLYGVELAIQNELNFLPGVLSNLSAKANYTYSQAEFDGDRSETTALPGQSPHVVNAAVNYKQDRFSAQLSYHWTAEMLTNLQETAQDAPSIGNNPMYLDRYQDGYSDLSASLSYQLSDEVQLWANIYNLLFTEQIEYAENREFYPTSIYKREGIEFNAGVRFSL